MPSGHFLPCTRTVEIAKGIVYRPVRSWHAGTYAGEGLEIVSGDRSGCLERVNGRIYASPPKSAIHRLYWHVNEPDWTLSAFLSYPGGLGICPEYFWEVLLGDAERFTGDHAEEEMEKVIVRELRARQRVKHLRGA